MSELRENRCPRCGDSIDQPSRGRIRLWCSSSCRRAADSERKAARPRKGRVLVPAIDRCRECGELFAYERLTRRRTYCSPLCRSRGRATLEVEKGVRSGLTRAEAQLARDRELLPCGTRAAYRRGCRCDDCRAAVSVYNADRVAERAERDLQRRLDDSSARLLGRLAREITARYRACPDCGARMARVSGAARCADCAYALARDKRHAWLKTDAGRARTLRQYIRRVESGRHAEQAARARRARAEARDEQLAAELGLEPVGKLRAL